MADSTFKKVFFRLYDRKIANGQVTFSELGINKAEFINLCIEEYFVFTEDKLIDICNIMKLTEEEEIELFDAAEKIRQERRDRGMDI